MAAEIERNQAIRLADQASLCSLRGGRRDTESHSGSRHLHGGCDGQSKTKRGASSVIRRSP